MQMQALTKAVFNNQTSPLLLDLWLKATPDPFIDEKRASMLDDALLEPLRRFLTIFPAISFVCLTIVIIVVSQTKIKINPSVEMNIPFVYLFLTLVPLPVRICLGRARAKKGERVSDFLEDCLALDQTLCGRWIGLCSEDYLRDNVRIMLLDKAKRIILFERSVISPDGSFADEETKGKAITAARKEFGELNALFARFGLTTKKWDQLIFDKAQQRLGEAKPVPTS